MDFERRPALWTVIRNKIHGLPGNDRPAVTMGTILDELELAAAQYKLKHSHSPALVIDNFTLLAEEDESTFKTFVRFAEDQADARGLAMTFVASDGEKTLRRLLAVSESSGLRQPPIEVGDLSDDDAVKYLVACMPPTSKQPKEEDFAARSLVAVTGGRLTLLAGVTSKLAEGLSVESIIQDLKSTAFRSVMSFDLVVPSDASYITKRHIKAWKAIDSCLDSEDFEVSDRVFGSVVGTLEMEKDLLAGNVFAVHPSRRTVGLQSRPMRIVLSERRAEMATHLNRAPKL